MGETLIHILYLQLRSTQAIVRCGMQFYFERFMLPMLEMNIQLPIPDQRNMAFCARVGGLRLIVDPRTFPGKLSTELVWNFATQAFRTLPVIDYNMN